MGRAPPQRGIWRYHRGIRLCRQDHRDHCARRRRRSSAPREGVAGARRGQGGVAGLRPDAGSPDRRRSLNSAVPRQLPAPRRGFVNVGSVPGFHPAEYHGDPANRRSAAVASVEPVFAARSSMLLVCKVGLRTVPAFRRAAIGGHARTHSPATRPILPFRSRCTTSSVRACVMA